MSRIKSDGAGAAASVLFSGFKLLIDVAQERNKKRGEWQMGALGAVRQAL